MTTLVFVNQSEELKLLLIGLGLVGVIIGGLSAIGTQNAKRMLAYSTLAQIGFILIGIGLRESYDGQSLMLGFLHCKQ